MADYDTNVDLDGYREVPSTDRSSASTLLRLESPALRNRSISASAARAAELSEDPTSPMSAVSTHVDADRFNMMVALTTHPSIEFNNLLEDHVDDLDPHICMKMLLKHLHLDPDGGVLNLMGHDSQHSKVKALKKGRLEKALAAFAFARTVANPVIVVYFAVKLIYGYYFHVAWVGELLKSTEGMRTLIPMQFCFVFTAVAELLGVTFLVLRALSSGVRALCWSIDAQEHHLHPRYIALATFYWRDILYLQTFSVLVPLAFVHPNLLTKNVKAFSLKEDIARKQLETFSNSSDVTTDETIKLQIGRLLAQHGSEGERHKSPDFVDAKPSKVLRKMCDSTVMLDRSFLESKGLKPNALSTCRFNFAAYVEGLALFALGLLCFSIGAIGFLTKMTKCYHLFMDESLNIGVPLAFFIGFLNQAMGILTVSRLFRWRVECFLFGGSDAYLSSEETFIMRVYLGTLMEVVWKSTELTPLDKWCVMFQFDDDDLQQLVIEDHLSEKAKVVLMVRRYMERSTAHLDFGDRLKEQIIACVA